MEADLTPTLFNLHFTTFTQLLDQQVFEISVEYVPLWHSGGPGQTSHRHFLVHTLCKQTVLLTQHFSKNIVDYVLLSHCGVLGQASQRHLLIYTSLHPHSSSFSTSSRCVVVSLFILSKSFRAFLTP